MKILKDSFIYLAGELFAKALPFLLLPYLTRRLGAAGFGELSFYQTVFSLLTVLFGMSQDGAVTRYFYVYGRRNLSAVVQAGYAYTALAAACALAYAWLAQSLLLAAVAAAAAAQTVLGTQLAVRQCQKQALAYTLIQFAAGLATALLTVLLLETTREAPVAMRFAAVLLGNALVAVAAVCWSAGSLKWRKTTLRRLKQALLYVLAFGLPLLLHHFSGYVKGQLDRVLIYQNYPAAALGVYSAGYQLASVFGVLLMAVNKATVPYFYQALKSGRIDAQRIRRWSLLSLALLPLPALAVWLLPEALFVWLLGAGYAGVKHYMVLFCIGFGLTVPYYLLVNYLFYHAQNRRIAAVSVLSTLGYLAALFAAARLGIGWIPLAMVAGNALILPILYSQVRRHHRENSLKAA